MVSFLATKEDMVTGLKRTLGQPPLEWYEKLDDSLRIMLDNIPSQDMELDQHFQLNYNHDDSQLLEIDEDDDEDEIPVEEYEKPTPELTDAELTAFVGILSRLLSYHPPARNTPATLLEALSCIGN